jgi:hypothetical protein
METEGELDARSLPRVLKTKFCQKFLRRDVHQAPSKPKQVLAK